MRRGINPGSAHIPVRDATGQEAHKASAQREGVPVHTSAQLARGSYVVEVGLFVGELRTAGKGPTPARLTTPYSITVTRK